MSDEEKPLRRPNIRPLSRDVATPLSRLRNCKCFDEIDRRLRLGWTSTDLVSAIRSEFGECLDISEQYLESMISQYRESIPPVELSMISTNSMVSRNATKRVAQGLDEVAELQRLYELQMKRIELDFGIEQKIGKNLGGTGREVFIAMKILDKSAQLKMDLGLSKRQLGSLEVNGQVVADITQRYGKDSVGAAITNAESRRKILSVVERLVALGPRANMEILDVEIAGKIPEPAQVTAEPLPGPGVPSVD